MSLNIRGRNFISLLDFSSEELEYLLNLSSELKSKKRAGIKTKCLDGKNIVLIFDKPSTRTRCSFEVAAYDEGAHLTFLSDSHMGHKESIEDTAKVLGRMYDGIEFRGFSNQTALDLAKYSGIPVWNGLTDKYHPTQILADFLTIKEHVKPKLHAVKFVYIGDARDNVAESLMVGAAKTGMHFVGIAPKSLWPQEENIQQMQQLGADKQAKIEFTEDLAAVEGADVIYSDVWVSMGEEDKWQERIELLKPYQITMDLIRQTANPQVVFMHCLPSFHDTNTEVGTQIKEKYGLDSMEVTDEVFRSKHSIVFEQAENRMHTIKAVMVATIG